MSIRNARSSKSPWLPSPKEVVEQIVKDIVNVTEVCCLGSASSRMLSKREGETRQSWAEYEPVL
jgi:hypothetical protein